jgi:hypothetical protein
MRRWEFVEQGEDGNSAVLVVMTDKEILDYYWEYWSKQMHRVGKGHLINEEDCILDFAVVHWAVELDEEQEKYNQILMALLGKREFIKDWWHSPNRSFDDTPPYQMWKTDKDRVKNYLLGQLNGDYS